MSGDPLGDKVWNLVHEQNAPVLLCGTPMMAEGVTNALNKLAADHGVDQSEQLYTDRLRAERRYERDVFA